MLIRWRREKNVLGIRSLLGGVESILIFYSFHKFIVKSLIKLKYDGSAPRDHKLGTLLFYNNLFIDFLSEFSSAGFPIISVVYFVAIFTGTPHINSPRNAINDTRLEIIIAAPNIHIHHIKFIHIPTQSGYESFF